MNEKLARCCTAIAEKCTNVVVLFYMSRRIETAGNIEVLYRAKIRRAVGEGGPLRSEEQVAECVRQFGELDILVNNASAIQLTRADATGLKRYDLMQDINAHGTFLCSNLCLPHLIGREDPQVPVDG